MISIPSDARIKESKILIIEDDRINAQLLTHHLNQEGYADVVCAVDGAEGLSMMESYSPDLVILDIIMPNMDGFEFIKCARAIPDFETIPIIFQTILSEMDHKLRAFEMGATDYIAKPLNKAELSARIRVHLLNKILIKKLIARQEIMENELVAARDMQDKLMPSVAQIKLAEDKYGLEIAHHFKTSSMLGGDCWGFHPLDDKRIAIFMFDLSGHGVGAAMNVFRLHALMQDLVDDAHNAGVFLSKLSDAAHKLFARHEFASMFYGIIDSEANCLQYAAAATPPILLFSPQQDSVILSGRGFPLGVVSPAHFDTNHVPFMRGDSLLLFSDCLTETPNNKGEMLDERTIADCIISSMLNNDDISARTVVSDLISLFSEHSDDALLRDDLTINLYQRK